MPDPLHIVCLGAPFPPDYGGGIDMYEKIKALSAEGRKIVLHYFDYGRRRTVGDLRKYCAAVFAYERKGPLSIVASSLPYIVSSRINAGLIDRLNQDDHPILIEGIHCAGIVPHIKRQRMNIVVRVHNDEAAYYERLSASAHSLPAQLYYRSESRRLERFQKNLPREIPLACLSTSDMTGLAGSYGFQETHFIPAFIPWQKVESRTGKGSFCLYHGNLEVAENERAATWLVMHVFAHLPVPFIIAGRGCPDRLKAAIAPFKNIKVISNPSAGELERLIIDAHIHVLPSYNSTGVKIKLLHALFAGRFCLTNRAGCQGSETLQGVCLAEEKDEWLEAVRNLMDVTFTQMDIVQRAAALAPYSNAVNATKLSALL